MLERLKMVLKAVILIIILLAIAILQVGLEKDKLVRDTMDRRELWYDADDYFVMVNTTDQIVGVYDAITPIYHFRCKIYREFEKDTVITVSDLEDYGIVLSPDLMNKICEICPEDTPVLIYEEDYQR